MAEHACGPVAAWGETEDPPGAGARGDRGRSAGRPRTGHPGRPPRRPGRPATRGPGDHGWRGGHGDPRPGGPGPGGRRMPPPPARSSRWPGRRGRPPTWPDRQAGAGQPLPGGGHRGRSRAERRGEPTGGQVPVVPGAAGGRDCGHERRAGPPDHEGAAPRPRSAGPRRRPGRAPWSPPARHHGPGEPHRRRGAAPAPTAGTRVAASTTSTPAATTARRCRPVGRWRNGSPLQSRPGAPRHGRGAGHAPSEARGIGCRGRPGVAGNAVPPPRRRSRRSATTASWPRSLGS